MNLVLHDQHRTYFLPIKYNLGELVHLGWEKIRRHLGTLLLILSGWEIFRITINRVILNQYTWSAIYHSFVQPNSSNGWFFVWGVVLIYGVYYRFAPAQSPQSRDFRHRFTKELKTCFDLAARTPTGATLKTILQKILTQTKMAPRLELNASEFVAKLKALESNESPEMMTQFWQQLIPKAGAHQLTIYDFTLALIEKYPAYQSLFFVSSIAAEDVAYFLQTLAAVEQLKQHRKKLFSATQIRHEQAMDKGLTGRPTHFLNSLGTDMTIQAKYHKYPYLIGREQEMTEILRLLTLPHTGVLLLGHAGTGKSSLAEGLATLMAAEQVPEALQDKRLISINVGLLASSTKNNAGKSGIVGLLEEAKAARNVVLVFDDLANLVGTEKQSADSGLDAFSILSNYIATQNIKVLASITPKDFTKYIQTNSASAGRHWETITMTELPQSEIFKILLLQAETLEHQARINFSVLALKSVYEFAHRYIEPAAFPAEGLQLLKEVALYAKEQQRVNITSDTVATLMSQKLHIKLNRVSQTESAQLLNLEKSIHERVIGQDATVSSIAKALRRARLNLHDTRKTVANFLFLGPTGVGKTELAKALAATYFGDEKKMIRVDMSEYQDKNAVNKLIGGPGSIGQLTAAVRQNPFALVLLDELEKAYPEIFNLFLQVMDDGRLTDGTGEVIDFTNTILITTSNAGSLDIQKYYKAKLSPAEIKEKMTATTLLQYFRPEFLNRFDDIIIFRPLAIEHLQQIPKLLLNELKTKLFQKRIYLTWDNAFITQFVKKHYTFELGARPLKRALQEEVSSKIAEKMLSGELTRNQTVRLTGDKIEVLPGTIH